MISDEELSTIDRELSFLPDDDKSLLLNHIANDQDINYSRKQYNVTRIFGIISAFSNLSFEVINLIKPLTPEQFNMTQLYFGLNCVCGVLYILSFIRKKIYKELIHIAFVLQTLRNITRLFDFENTNSVIPVKTQALQIVQGQFAYTFLLLNISTFNTSNWHVFTNSLIIAYITVGFYIACEPMYG